MPSFTAQTSTFDKIKILAGSEQMAAAACVDLLRLNEGYLDFLDRFDVTGADLSRLYVNTCDRNTRKLALLLIAAANEREGLSGVMLIRAGSISRPQLDAAWQMDDDIHHPSI